MRGLCRLRGLQSDPNPRLPAVTVTGGAWGSAGPGARLGSLGEPSAEALVATCAPGARSVLCPRKTVHGSTISG